MTREFVLHDEIVVRAPIERCFLLSTNLALVERELHMRPVRGRTTGNVIGGDVIRWQGWKLGLPQIHESLIEDFHPPVFFRDRMIAGRFRTFSHDHNFVQQRDSTVLLADDLRFTMRWGILGENLGSILLVPHIRRLMQRRFKMLKRVAEGEEWREFLGF